ncbi:winged helix-turn-helix transcriptional regulator [Kutzneria sp. CA-103260]|uniref:winged helix-turn-helix transcriptional regulator n=1 Tax=Kutzneria sp. CA-103260 TaxID=2802641 RepID=UPI001BA5C76B|nr:winged helix-turn-helix transcriptional regulator [Kutzneria sp. CA-103260]QUQ66351.1 transcriptional regulator [Kutzneria sp. CA-103260]
MNIKRAYHQYCGLASALDVLGERWTLLIVRELLLGPRRYSDLLADLPGLGTNLLADRLKFLVDKGVIRQCLSRPAYELTEAGALLRPVVLDLTRWGFGFTPDKSTVDAVRPRWGFLAAETRLRAEWAGDVDEDYEFHVDDEVFRFEVRAGQVQAAAGRAPGQATVVATADAVTLVRLGSGQMTAADALAAGELTISGPTDAVQRCRRLLDLA